MVRNCTSNNSNNSSSRNRADKQRIPKLRSKWLLCTLCAYDACFIAINRRIRSKNSLSSAILSPLVTFPRGMLQKIQNILVDLDVVLRMLGFFFLWFLVYSEQSMCDQMCTIQVISLRQSLTMRSSVLQIGIFWIKSIEDQANNANNVENMRVIERSAREYIWIILLTVK